MQSMPVSLSGLLYTHYIEEGGKKLRNFMVRAINDEWIAKGDMRCPGTSSENVFVTSLHK